MTQQVVSQDWVLVADIGGTNARFAAVTADTGRTLSASLIIPTDITSSFLSAMIQVVPQLGDSDRLVGMVLAIAAPVDNDIVKLTNADWVIDKNTLQQHFETDNVHIINDFAALSYALPHLIADDYITLQQGEEAAMGHLAVIGPGTGLGVGGLYCAPDGTCWPITGEGGHMTYAPETEQEWSIFNGLKEIYGRVSYERVVTGNGLYQMAKILGAGDVVQSPQDVTDLAARHACPACSEAIDIFLSGLGKVAGDVALTINASCGVYVAGGIVPKLLNHLDLTPLLDAFVNKGRNQCRMERIPLRLMTHPAPAFLGLRAVAQNILFKP